MSFQVEGGGFGNCLCGGGSTSSNTCVNSDAPAMVACVF